jgi:hypothetical protein
MAKLNQIIAIEKGIKAKSYAEISALHKVIQKPALFNGFQKTYKPKDDDDSEKLPAEKQRVQFSTDEVLRSVERAMTELINVTARKDYTNCIAVSDVILPDGQHIIKDAPVSFLLFLEKQMNDLRTFAAELPILDEGENWIKDVNSGLFKADETNTHRTKKMSKPIVLYPATPEHPAQTQIMTEDVIAGFWSQVKQSGAMPKPMKAALLARIDALQNAIKQAREAANMNDEVDTGKIGIAIFNYLTEVTEGS